MSVTANGPVTHSKSPAKGNPATKDKRTREQNRKQLQTELSQGELACEIVWWTTPPHSTHKDLIQALTDAALDPQIAKEFNAEKAAGRALKALEEDRDITVVRRDGGEVVFQFTKRQMVSSSDEESSTEYEYSKECYLRLDKSTGKVTCKRKPELAKDVQQKLDAAMELRTRSDITEIVKRVFQSHKAMLPYIGNGGVYLVVKEHQSFADQVEVFLNKIGGELLRMPVPRGTKHGDRAVQKTMEESIKKLIEDHQKAVAEFQPTSSKASMTSQAQKVQETRLKIEGYFHYLTKKLGDELLDAVDLCKQEIAQKLEQQEKYKESLPKQEGPMGTDEWGTRLGTARAAFNAAVGKKPKTVEEICAEAKCKPKPNHLKNLLDNKLVLKTPDGKYYRNPNPPAVKLNGKEDE